MTRAPPRLGSHTLTALAAIVALSLLAWAPPVAAAPATAKDMTFFLHYVSDPANASKTLPGAGSTLTYFDTTTQWNNTNATFYANGSQQNFAWYLVPALAGPVNLTSFSFAIWAQSLTGGGSNAQTTVALYERNDTGAETLVTSANFGSQNYLNTPTLKQLNATLVPAHVFPAGSSVKVLFTLNPGTGSIEVFFDTARADSRIVFNTADSIAVSSVDVTDSAGISVSSLDPIAPNTTAHFRATVSDPYGGYDVARASLTILSPTGAVLVDNASMPRVSGTPLSLDTGFDLAWNYSGQPPGQYTAVVYAMDNNGENWFTHFAQFSYGPYGDWLASSFFIGSLPLYAWVKVVDDHAVALGGASVTLEASGSPVASGVTDASGLVNLTAFAGNYTLKAVWAGVQVASVALNLSDNVTQGSAVQVAASVYYPTLKVVDSHGAPVEYAFAYLLYANGTSTIVPFRTDDNGSVALSQITGGPLAVRVLWRGVEVAAMTATVSSSGEVQVPASVFYLTVQVNDGAGAPLPLALVRMDDSIFGLLSVADVTGASGNITDRLPTGTYDLDVSWRGVEVGSASAQALSADATVTIAARVFVLTVKTVAADGSPLGGATVTVTNSAGAVYEVAVTDAGGTATVRAPSGTYSVSAHVIATSFWTPVEETERTSNVTLDQARTVELKFTEAPGSFVGSNMFLAVVVILLLLLLLVAALRRKGRKPSGTPEHVGMGAQAEAKPGETKQIQK